MAGEHVESLVREYRGWKYVIDDLFADDAERLAEDGWYVVSTEWRVSSENTRFIWRLVNWWPPRYPWRRPERREYLLTVTYERHSP